MMWFGVWKLGYDSCRLSGSIFSTLSTYLNYMMSLRGALSFFSLVGLLLFSLGCSGARPGASSGPDVVLSERAPVSPGPGTAIRFPARGEMRALIVFVQHLDDSYEDCRQFTGYDALGIPSFKASINYKTHCERKRKDSWKPGGYQSYTDDQASEWPVNLPKGPDAARTRQLPRWGEDLIDTPGSQRFTPGSLSDFYYRMSNGSFTLTGEVWNYTYVPKHPKPWYDTNKGPFANGVIKLSHEILSYVNAHPHGIDLNNAGWDRYTNGDGTRATPDGNFDMVILVFRFTGLRNLGPNQFKRKETSVTSLGHKTASQGDSFSRNPLRLGRFRVIDNTFGGSGVISHALTRKSALRIIAHEIGHRQFGLYHTDLSPQGPLTDFTSIMNGSPHLSFSAADRVKLGWANVQYVDMAQPGSEQTFLLRDAAVPDPEEPDVIWLQYGNQAECGDILVEARFRSTYWDKPPGRGNDDGDGADYYLPNEGLYITKAAAAHGSRCGGTRQEYSSLPKSSLNVRRKNFGADRFNPRGMYEPGFGPGDTFNASINPGIQVHKAPQLDPLVVITNIRREGNAFRFTVKRRK